MLANLFIKLLPCEIIGFAILLVLGGVWAYLKVNNSDKITRLLGKSRARKDVIPQNPPPPEFSNKNVKDNLSDFESK